MKIIANLFCGIFIICFFGVLWFLLLEWNWLVNTIENEVIISIAIFISVLLGYLIGKGLSRYRNEVKNLWAIKFCIYLFLMAGIVSITSYLNRTLQIVSSTVERVVLEDKLYKEKTLKTPAEWRILISIDDSQEEILVSEEFWKSLTNEKHVDLTINKGALGFHFITPPKYRDGKAI
jgi:hypothetical protein